MLPSFDMSSLSQLCNSVCSTPIVSGSDVDPESEREAFFPFPLSPDRDKDIYTWQLAQVASFCLSTQILANPTLPDREQPPPLLQSTQWFRLTTKRGVNVGTRDDVHLVMLHALANRAVGFFFRELCWAMSKGNVYDKHVEPALPLSFPLATLCATPVPFTPGGIARLSMCHLSSMTAPSFFTDGEWTGYTSLGTEPNNLKFERISSGDPDPFCNLTEVDRTIRFRLVQEWDGGKKYLLESNPFNYASTVFVRVTVERDTGYLKIAYHGVGIPWRMVNDAVITPFGIVHAEDAPGAWTWIWKSRWSGIKA